MKKPNSGVRILGFFIFVFIILLLMTSMIRFLIYTYLGIIPSQNYISKAMIGAPYTFRPNAGILWYGCVCKNMICKSIQAKQGKENEMSG